MPTDRQLADSAWSELTLTTDSYPSWVHKGKPSSSHWAHAKAYLDQIGISPPLPPPVDNRKHFTGGNLDAFIAGLQPGDNAVMDIGGNLTAAVRNGGTSAAPITLDLNKKIIDGRLDMRGGANFWNIGNGGMRDLSPQGPNHYQSWIIGGSDCNFHDLDCVNGHTKIGWETIDDPTYGSSHRVEFRNMRVHDIGTLPNDNQEHGFYDSGYSAHYVDCLVYDCSDRAFQLRGAKSSHIEYCTYTGCGQGIIFGDLGATNCLVENCIGTNNLESSRYLIEENDSAHNVNNIVRNGFAWNSDGRKPIQGGITVSISNVKNINPQLDANYIPAS